MSKSLQEIRSDLEYIQNSLISYGKCQTMPPIIDSAFEHEHRGEGHAKPDPLDNPLLSNLRDPIPGLRIFRESVKRDMELLDKVCTLMSAYNIVYALYGLIRRMFQ